MKKKSLINQSNLYLNKINFYKTYYTLVSKKFLHKAISFLSKNTNYLNPPEPKKKKKKKKKKIKKTSIVYGFLKEIVTYIASLEVLGGVKMLIF